ncbi:hypothetical protein [Paenibacillus sp. MZ03-122A]|uniref:hypothetical protein n=1 Tax=Paenibacillus sp. MZ03-122A TaxID=2962033 RepID=UPI0020B80252|nr:hypothetical protein [Paenibacillus sp. MZ03-122A]MCP3780430.1 hypothetical protein [Paenibacillus sp. MZ03-122A]
MENRQWIPSAQANGTIIATLVSQGLLYQSDVRGGYGFRHPILRDFTMAQYVLRHAREQVSHLTEMLNRIRYPIIADGVHRSLVEALISDQYISLEQYVTTSSRSHQGNIVRIIGRLKPPENFSIEVWHRKPHPSFLAKLIETAQHAKNSNWIYYFATLSHSVNWVERRDWIGASTIDDLAMYIRVVSERIVSDGQINKLQELSEMMIQWSYAPKFRAYYHQDTSIRAADLIPIVSHWATPGTYISFLKDGGHDYLRRIGNLDDYEELFEWIELEQ